MTETLEVFNYRTPQGCHVWGHRKPNGDEFINLATEPPPVLRLGRQDQPGKAWPQ